jgi:hypothetical protein
MPLITVSTTVMTVLHSAEVVHIPHESRFSWVATFGVFVRTSLQGFLRTSSNLTVPAEVSLEVLVQITMGPPLTPCGFRRVHSSTQSFLTRRIRRESALPAPPISTPNYFLPHTMPGCTRIGSWLYHFHGWSLHELILRFGHDD